jgi:hypothetical protein
VAHFRISAHVVIDFIQKKFWKIKQRSVAIIFPSGNKMISSETLASSAFNKTSCIKKFLPA